MTWSPVLGILIERVCRAWAYYAMKREIAQKTEVTFVEYVRCRISVRHAIGRLKLSGTRVYRADGRSDRLKKAGLFFGRGLIRTVVCTEKTLHPYA